MTMKLTKRFYIFGLLLTNIAISARASELDKDHPIYDVQSLTGSFLPSVERYSPLEAPLAGITWSMKLSKAKFYVGEPIWGKLILKNTAEHRAYHLSPPYRGSRVSTLSVWVSYARGSGTEKGDVWTALKQISWEDRGSNLGYGGLKRDRVSGQYQGRRCVLSPGEEYTASIPVNVSMVSINSDQPQWTPGVGFSKPGKYRFYIRYVNTGVISNYETASNVAAAQGEEPEAQTPTGLDRRNTARLLVATDVPPKARVLGPFDIEVLPLPEKSDEAVDAIETFRSYLFDAETRNRPHGDDISNRIYDKSPDLLRAVRGPLSDPKYNLRGSIEFMFLKEGSVESFEIPFADTCRPSMQAYNKRLKNIEALLSHLQKDDPLREHVELMRCQAFYRLGRVEEALQLAKRIDTPDAHVFIDDVMFAREAQEPNNPK